MHAPHVCLQQKLPSINVAANTANLVFIVVVNPVHVLLKIAKGFSAERAHFRRLGSSLRVHIALVFPEILDDVKGSAALGANVGTFSNVVDF